MNDTENLILIHYHEIGLKGKNRGRFESQLQSNINRTLKGLSRGSVQRLFGRIILKLKPDSPIGVIRDRLTGIAGIANFSEAVRVPKDIEFFRETAWAVAQKATFESFRITTKRGDKSFPMTSEEVNRDVGQINQVWKEYLGDHPVNRRCYGVDLQAGMLVEAGFVAEFPAA